MSETSHKSRARVDYVGQRFGMLTVLADAEPAPNGSRRVLCRCDCGTERVVWLSNLRSGHTVSCGCKKQNDLTGQHIGNLTVLGRSDRYGPRGARKTPLWQCRCDCGAIVYKATDTLTNPESNMCNACVGKYAMSKRREKAGFVDGTEISRIKSDKPIATNTSGVRGVYFDKHSGKWRARLRFKGQLMNFGSYDKFADAVAARKEAEAEYYGEFLQETRKR